MSRTRRFLHGAALGYVQMALSMIVGLWMAPFILGKVGQRDYGLWLVATQITAYLTLLDVGASPLISRETSFATGRAGGYENAPEIPGLVGRGARTLLWQTPFVVTGCVGVWVLLPADWAALRVPLAIVLVGFAVLFPFRLYYAVLEGLQDLAYVGRAGIVAWSLGTGLTIALLVHGDGLLALAIGWVVVQAVRTLAFGVRLHTTFRVVVPSKIPSLPWAELRTLVARGFWISLAQIAVALFAGTDMLVLGRLMSPEAVVPYSCTGRLVTVLDNQPKMILEAARPGLSELRTSKDPAHVRSVCVALTLAVLITTGLIACLVLAVNPGFVAWWIGPTQFAGMRLTALLLANMMLRHWSGTTIYTMFAFGHDRRISMALLGDGLVTLGSMIVLVRMLGLVGAPLGSMVGVCTVALPLGLLTLAKETKSPVLSYVTPYFGWLLRFLVLAAGAYALQREWTSGTFVRLAITSIGVTLAYVGVMLPLAMRSTLGEYLRRLRT